MLRKPALLALLAFAPLAAPALGQDWTKSKWGPNDEIGSANYIKPDLVVKAAQLVKTGKAYNLGIETNAKTPAFPPRTFKLTIVQPGQAGIPGLGPNKTTYNDDIIDGWVGVGSQIDGLGHIGVEHVYYNGTKLADFADASGPQEVRRGENPAARCPRRAARHGGPLRHRHRQGGHRLQHQGDRGGRQEAGRRNPAGRRRALPYRLGRPDRQGRQALQRWASRGLASTAPSISSARACLPSVPTAGGWRWCPSRARPSSRCTRSCCR